MSEIQNKVVIITGASSGLGAATAERLAASGAKLMLAARREDRRHQFLESISKSGQKADYLVTDVSDRAQVEALAQKTLSTYGRIDVLVNNAGLMPLSPLDALKVDVGIGHFVYSSVGSAERKTGVPHFDSKFQIEEYLRASGLPYTILRPVFFLFNYNGMRSIVETGTLSQPLSPDTKLQQLSEEDYGEMVADVFVGGRVTFALAIASPLENWVKQAA